MIEVIEILAFVQLGSRPGSRHLSSSSTGNSATVEYHDSFGTFCLFTTSDQVSD
jgi:hypothetical protein